MTSRAAGSLRIAGKVCIALCLTPLTAGCSVAATAPIYKCFDNRLGLVYTDLPCKDGVPLDVRAGDADPGAVAWLERQRDALDQSAAQRLADERHTAAAAALASPLPGEPADQGGGYDNAAAYGFLNYPFMHRHPLRREPRVHRIRHFALPAPHLVRRP